MSALALRGGAPVRTRPFASWPVHDTREETSLLEVLHSGHWNRWEGERVQDFESRFAAYLEISHALAVSSGTAALECAVHAAGVGPGDEVILPAYGYTMPACAVLRVGGVPVFADVDLETFNLDPKAVEAAVTPRTRAVMPIHLGGLPADMDGLLEVAHRHRILIIEDAALATGSTWRGRKVGAVGDVGIFSCQAEKNLNCGEGGIVVTDDYGRWARALAFHDYWKGMLLPQPGWEHLCCTFRITEFQAAILLAQLERLEAQTEIRAANAAALDVRLRDIEGVRPRRRDPGATRDACTLYMFRYDPAAFGGLPKAKFVEALQAEGIPAIGGYGRPVTQNPIFTEPERWRERHCVQLVEAGIDYREMRFPAAERLCAGEAVWLRQQTMLCPREDTDDVVRAILKIKEHAGELLES